MRTFNFGVNIAPQEIMNVIRQGKAFDIDLKRTVKLSGTDKLKFNGTLKTFADWLTLADNDTKEFHTTISKLPNGKILPIEVFPTDTDYAICIYIVKGLYRVTVFDTIQQKNVEKVGKYEQWSDATDKAKEVVKQYC